VPHGARPSALLRRRAPRRQAGQLPRQLPGRGQDQRLCYFSPERFEPDAYAELRDAMAVDVWGLGLTVLELFLGRSPIVPTWGILPMTTGRRRSATGSRRPCRSTWRRRRSFEISWTRACRSIRRAVPGCCSCSGTPSSRAAMSRRRAEPCESSSSRPCSAGAGTSVLYIQACSMELYSGLGFLASHQLCTTESVIPSNNFFYCSPIIV
jgi:hypothetical protein